MISTRAQVFDEGRVAERIQRIIAEKHIAFHLVVTGGGGGAPGMFLDIPGVSKILQGVSIPYATEEFDMLTSINWRGAGFSYCGWEAAIALAQAGYFTCQDVMARKGDFTTPCIGIAVTAALTTDRTLNGGSRLHAAVVSEDGIFTITIKMDQTQTSRIAGGAICDLTVLNLLLFTLGMEQVPYKPDLNLDSSCLVMAGENLIIHPRPFELTGMPEQLDAPMLVKLDGSVVPATGLDYAECIIMAVSANPLTHGHIEIAHMAQIATGKQVMFELSFVNADKAAQPLSELIRRTKQFAGQFEVVIRPDAGLFINKLGLYTNNGASQFGGFVAGADTLKRLLDPVYYGGDEGLLDVLRQFNAAGVRFYVPDRIMDSKLVSIANLNIPYGFQHMFVRLAGQWDISSSMWRHGRAMRIEE